MERNANVTWEKNTSIVWEKTKIVTTLGPASRGKDVLRQVMLAGADVCRINFSHEDHDYHGETIRTIRELNEELGTSIPILADLQGPKIRIGMVEVNAEGKDKIFLKDGSELIITSNKCVGTPERLYLSYPAFPQDVAEGDTLLIDDGKLSLRVLSSNRVDEVKCVVVNGGDLSSKKGVNLPNTKISMPCLTEKDLADLQFVLDQNVEWVGLSFVRCAQDIIDMKAIINAHKNKFKARVVAKIEKPEAVKDMDAIIEVTDAIMVARGDLGVEIPMEEVPIVQKQLVQKCMKAGKPVIIATQMMESMITNFRPTRAEVNDVANGVMDGADAVMLSAETSVGKFPVGVVQTVQKIISEVEKYDGIYYKHSLPIFEKNDKGIANEIAYSACAIAKQVGAKAILGLSSTGYAAYRLSAFRPKAGIFIFTNNKPLLSTMNLSWGVRGIYYEESNNTEKAIEDMKKYMIEEGILQKGDVVVITASTPIEIHGKSNMLKVDIL